MTKTDDDRIAELAAKQKSIEARLDALRARSKERARKDDTRRKVLVGAVILTESEQSEPAKQRLMTLLDKHLVRDIDRAVFGLPARAVAAPISPTNATEMPQPITS